MGAALEQYSIGAATMNKSRLTNVDVLRGVASIAVCWFHLTNTYAEDSPLRASGSYGWLGVEIFFVLSGFIIPYAMSTGEYTLKAGWKTFLGKRLARIEPPYLASIALVVALWYASSLAPGFRGAPPPNVFSAQTLLHIGYLNGIAGYPWLNVVYWSLAIEFQFYLLMLFVFGWINHSRRFFASLAVLILVGSVAILDQQTLVFKYLGLFAFGLAAFQYRRTLIDRRMLVFLFTVAIAVTGIQFGWLVSIVGVTMGLLLAFDVKLGSHKLMIWLGSISCSLYLVHVPIGGRVVNLGKRYVDSQSGEALLSIVALLVSLIAAYLFYLTIEKPSQNWATKLKYPSRREQSTDGLSFPCAGAKTKFVPAEQ